MNVAQLKKELEYWDDNMEVCFKYDYGDYSHHIIVEEIQQAYTVNVRRSDYTGTDVVDDDGDKEVLVLGRYRE